MSQSRNVPGRLELLNGHVRVMAQSTRNGVAAVAGLRRSVKYTTESSAAVAVDNCENVRRLFDSCRKSADRLFAETESTEDRKQVILAIGRARELADIAERTQRIARLALRYRDSFVNHPAVVGTLGHLVARVNSAIDLTRRVDSADRTTMPPYLAESTRFYQPASRAS